MAEQLEAQGYGIGTVAGLTGIDAHTIRAWERRYAAVVPGRTPTGRRRYSSEAVHRLQLLKAAVDCGEPIGSVAGLGDDALRKRLAELTGSLERRVVGTPRVALAAPTLTRQIEAAGGATGGFDVVASVQDVAGLCLEIEGGGVDLVLVEVGLLSDRPEPALKEIEAAAPGALVVALYSFERRALLARLARRGARLVRGPISTAVLGQALADLLMIEAATGVPQRAPAEAPTGEAPARLFDDRQLAALMEIQGSVDCECPSQLSSLVASVVAFERYSHDCESRTPEDAAVHRRLAVGAGRARAELERVLVHLCEHDGIRL